MYQNKIYPDLENDMMLFSKDSENLINYTFHLNIQHIFVVWPTTANIDGWAKCAMQINNI